MTGQDTVAGAVFTAVPSLFTASTVTVRFDRAALRPISKVYVLLPVPFAGMRPVLSFVDAPA